MNTIRAQLTPLIRALTIAEVARRSGVPAPNISDWLAGRSTITVETAERLAAACGAKITVQTLA